MASIAFVVPSTWNGQTIGAGGTAVSYVNQPTTINVTALTASTAYVMQITDPSGGSFSVNFTSSVAGTFSYTYSPTTLGTLTVTIFPQTPFPTGTGVAPLSSMPIQPQLPSLILGAQVLAPVNFNVISGN